MNNQNLAQQLSKLLCERTLDQVSLGACETMLSLLDEVGFWISAGEVAEEKLLDVILDDAVDDFIDISVEKKRWRKQGYVPKVRASMPDTVICRHDCLPDTAARCSIREEYQSMKTEDQWAFIREHVERQPVERRRGSAGNADTHSGGEEERGEDMDVEEEEIDEEAFDSEIPPSYRRNRTCRYTLRGQRVCKKAFFSIIGAADSVMRNAFDRKFSMAPLRAAKRSESSKAMRAQIREDISRYPAVESHYCRSSSNFRYLPHGLSIAKMYRTFISKLKTDDPNNAKLLPSLKVP